MAMPVSLSSKKGIVPFGFFSKNMGLRVPNHLLSLDSSISIGKALAYIKATK